MLIVCCPDEYRKRFGRNGCSAAAAHRTGVELTPTDCAKTVPKPFLFEWLGLASSEKQIPQVVVIVRNQKSGKEHLEAVSLRPRQLPAYCNNMNFEPAL